jgi:hypothetical protein
VSAAPLDLRTPQMTCPTCHATVGITKKGTVAQHTRRRTTTGWRFATGTERCPSSFAAAPDGAHAAWLRGMSAERLRAIDSARAERDEIMRKVFALDVRIDTMKERVVEIDAALAAIGVTP